MPTSPPDMSVATLQEGYAKRRFTVREVLDDVRERMDAYADYNLWITRIGQEDLDRMVEKLGDPARPDFKKYPLYGIPFALKDNIDFAGYPTTVACPDYAYTPETSAPIMEWLLEAGAIPVGKTNMDQLASGLVGIRTPYGEVPNAVVPEYIAGGSSSGSAVATALRIVSFALGSDTAGSVRGPAALNGIIGLKPTVGLVSSRGFVPAVLSVDCPGVFATNMDDAMRIFDVIARYDAAPFSRRAPEDFGPGSVPDVKKLGVPRANQLEFFGDEDAAALFEQAIKRAEKTGVTVSEFDFAPFKAAGDLLYDGPWIAERHFTFKDFIAENPDAVLPVTRSILEGGKGWTADQVFEGIYELERCRAETDATWQAVDAIMVPGVPTVYTREAIRAEPVKLNVNLSYYVTFMNMLGLSGLTVPAGSYENGMPFGVTFAALPFHDYSLAGLGKKFLDAAG